MYHFTIDSRRIKYQDNMRQIYSESDNVVKDLLNSLDVAVEGNNITIKCKDGVILANSFILSSRNEYFKAMFNPHSIFTESKENGQ